MYISRKGLSITSYSIAMVVLKTHIYMICLMFEIRQTLILKGDLKLFFYPNIRCYIWRVVYISCGMVVRHRWHFHGSFHLQKIIVQNQYYTRWYNKGGSRMTLRRTSIRDYFMECVHNHKTLLLHLEYCALSSSMHLVLLDWCIVSQFVAGPPTNATYLVQEKYYSKYKITQTKYKDIWSLFLAVYKAISNPSFTSNPSIWNQPDPFDISPRIAQTCFTYDCWHIPQFQKG